MTGEYQSWCDLYNIFKWHMNRSRYTHANSHGTFLYWVALKLCDAWKCHNQIVDYSRAMSPTSPVYTFCDVFTIYLIRFDERTNECKRSSNQILYPSCDGCLFDISLLQCHIILLLFFLQFFVCRGPRLCQSQAKQSAQG